MFTGNSEKRRAALIAYAPLILWIGVIFFLSSGQGSMSETSRIIRPILVFLFPSASEETLQIYHFYIRKAAHFTEYAILSFWALRALSGSSVHVLKSYRFIVSFGLVLLICAIDETNQAFISSRTGSAWDALLDASGGLAMILFLWMLRLPRARRK